jgi:FAD/FMN-containing dehydrogenase
MSPELRAGNASLRAGGDETLEAVQRASAAAGQFLPVTARDTLTVRELLQRRDGGPLEARYGRLRDRLLAAGVGGLSFGSEAVKDVTGNDLRRLLLGSDAVHWEWAVFRLGQLPERRERLLAHGGDAFALAEALRSDPAEPAAIVVLEPGLVAIADDCGSDEQPRRRAHAERCTRAAGASLEEIDEDGWLALCEGLPASAVRMAGRRARVVLPAHTGAWAYDAGRRLALVPASDRATFAPERPAPPARGELVAAVIGAVGV